MALASFKLMKCTGASASTETDCSKHPCFISVDQVSIDTATYAIPAPVSSGAVTYSYENWLRLEMTAVPDNYCQTFKVFGSSEQPDFEDSPGDKLTIMLGTTASGATPTDSVSSVATTAQHSNYYSAATGLAIGVDPSNGVMDTIGEQTDYLVAQLKIAFDVQQGEVDTMTLQWSYEEA